MTSFRWSATAAVFAGLLAMSGCPAGDDTESDTEAATTMPTTTAGTDASTGPADSSGGPSGSGTELSHAADIQPIWDEHCTAACHEPSGEWEFLDMAPGAAYANIVGVMSTQATDLAFVEPGDVEGSYLWHKINASQAMAGGGGLDMPKTRMGEDPTVMTQEQLDTVREWIEAGAPE